jgi:hypothetical protein
MADALRKAGVSSAVDAVECDEGRGGSSCDVIRIVAK